MSAPVQHDYANPVAFIRQRADELRRLRKHLEEAGHSSAELPGLTMVAGLLSGIASNLEREQRPVLAHPVTDFGEAAPL